MIFFHSIKRKIEKGDPSARIVLEMPYDDVRDLEHILWECRKNDMLENENQKLLQLEFQNLKHLMCDGMALDAFEVCHIHERLEEIDSGDIHQGIDPWMYVEDRDYKLPAECGEDWVLVTVKEPKSGEEFNKPYIAEHRSDGHWYLDDQHNTMIGSKEFPFEVVKWRKI